MRCAGAGAGNDGGVLFVVCCYGCVRAEVPSSARAWLGGDTRNILMASPYGNDAQHRDIPSIVSAQPR